MSSFLSRQLSACLCGGIEDESKRRNIATSFFYVCAECSFEFIRDAAAAESGAKGKHTEQCSQQNFDEMAERIQLSTRLEMEKIWDSTRRTHGRTRVKWLHTTRNDTTNENRYHVIFFLPGPERKADARNNNLKNKLDDVSYVRLIHNRPKCYPHPAGKQWIN